MPTLAAPVVRHVLDVDDLAPDELTAVLNLAQKQDPFAVLAGLGVALVFGYAWSWVMAVVGLLVRTAEAVQAAVYIVVFPLGFTSAVFVPTPTMPAWLQPFAAHQPVTVTADAVRGLTLGPGALVPGQTVAGQVGLSLLWATAITAVCLPLAVRAYRRTVT